VQADAEGGGQGGRVAYVVFSQPEELDRALGLCGGGEAVRCDIGTTGARKWCEDYASRRPKSTALDTAANLVVGQYDRCAAYQQKARKRLSQPDSDGWVTVTSRRPQSNGPQNPRKKKKEKKLTNFYLFQQRESKREAVAELRRKFLKDKERVAQLRTRRRFRPF
jgi:ribosomal RNA-processing protein 7